MDAAFASLLDRVAFVSGEPRGEAAVALAVTTVGAGIEVSVRLARCRRTAR